MILDYFAYGILIGIAVFVALFILDYIVNHWDEVGGVVVFVSIIVVALWALLRVI
jgi:hypothetical protein